MKQKKDYTLLALLIPFLFALVFSGALSGCDNNLMPFECMYEGRECPNYNDCKGHDKELFHVGDTLYPSYANCDTLIVTNIGSADTLNMVFNGEGLPTVATDSEIDSVLHKHCRTYYHTCKWKLCPYKGITEANFGSSVAAYVGNNESEAYSLDILHLYSPAAEYEELLIMLEED